MVDAVGGAWRLDGSFRTWVEFFVLWVSGSFSTGLRPALFRPATGILRKYQ